jgi:hypothetical protein
LRGSADCWGRQKQFGAYTVGATSEQTTRDHLHKKSFDWCASDKWFGEACGKHFLGGTSRGE